jgi:CHASE3 domain sensor protein
MKPSVAVTIGIVLFVLVGIASFYLSQASNAPEGEVQSMEAPDPGPQ